ncbi:MAG TPA: DUF5655 domain-containing protein [Dehalococcoidia bacterium]|jgi:predicted transport protein|nr:DUF5655 domain-containing protein [Dehalococcoidia bacterium]
MTDIKLFRLNESLATELVPAKPILEKHVQQRFERNLEVLLGVRFVASEYSTGKKHLGRIDSLGIDENSSPVIIEYKLHQNENVINQGLFYLDWLLDHRAEFESIAKGKLRPGEEVDWSAPRVVCIAEDFTRYDVFAVDQIGRSIELIRYKLYEDLIVLELVNRPQSGGKQNSSLPSMTTASGISKPLETAQEIIEALETKIMAFGDDVQRKQLKHYVAYRRLKNFASVEPFKGHVLVFLRVDPSTIQLEEGFSRDVTKIGHHASGDLELRLADLKDIERAMPLISLSYSSA